MFGRTLGNGVLQMVQSLKEQGKLLHLKEENELTSKTTFVLVEHQVEEDVKFY